MIITSAAIVVGRRPIVGPVRFGHEIPVWSKRMPFKFLHDIPLYEPARRCECFVLGKADCIFAYDCHFLSTVIKLNLFVIPIVFLKTLQEVGL